MIMRRFSLHSPNVGFEKVAKITGVPLKEVDRFRRDVLALRQEAKEIEYLRATSAGHYPRSSPPVSDEVLQRLESFLKKELTRDDLSRLRDIYHRPLERRRLNELSDWELREKLKKHVALHARNKSYKTWPREAFSFLHFYGIGVKQLTLGEIGEKLNSSPRKVKTYIDTFRNTLRGEKYGFTKN